MAFGIYVHIPYCLQRCRYCDFTTFEFSEIQPPAEYLELVLSEIRNRSRWFKPGPLTSLYFGGGTPSLVPAEHIVSIIQELANAGFIIQPTTEVTIEINPATMDEDKLGVHLENGINRFSVGAQSFDDQLLKLCGRRHTASETRATLDLLAQNQVNYSFDLLFALPGQTQAQLRKDLDEVALYDPPHLSAYCLTVPSGHPMASGRPKESRQIEMFDLIEDHLQQVGLDKYEISNFAQPGRESRHNLLYWTDQAYWGIGLSAHSYLPVHPYGARFWNPSNLKEYGAQIADFKGDGSLAFDQLPKRQVERLSLNEALTDYCHTSLRCSQGILAHSLENKFGPNILELVRKRSLNPSLEGLVTTHPSGWRLTRKGEHLSNRVFLDFTFTKAELDL